MQPNPKMLREMQAMQKKLMQAQEELGNETVEVTVGGGALTMVMTGHQKVQSVTLSPDAVDPEDIETLQDLIVSAVNEAVDKSQELASKKMGGMTGGLKIPGMF
jgi:nucleoid-associated protein EbfC